MRKKNEEYYQLPSVFRTAVREYGSDNGKSFRILPNSMMAKILILFFIVIDFSFIKQLTDCYFVETWWKTLASALVVAVLMDIMPSIMAELAKTKCKTWYTYIEIGITAAVFLVVFAVVFVVRWYSQDMIYETSSTQLQITSSFIAETTEAEGETAGRTAMTILFGIIPLVTSIISFFVSYYDEPSADAGKNSRKLHYLYLKAQLINTAGNMEELENETQRDIRGYDDANKALMLDDLNQYRKISCEKAKLKAVIKRKEPEILHFLPSNLKGV